MKAVKILAALAVALIGTSAFAEGFSAHGYIRSGIETVVVNDGSGGDPAKIFKTAADNDTGYFGGYNLGLGADRVRLNLAYDTKQAGVKFRYQTGDDFTDTMSFPLITDHIKYLFGYVNLFENHLTVEAGKLNGGKTGTNGDGSYSFGGRDGVRIAVLPVSGLVFDVVASTKYLEKEGDSYKSSVNAFSFSAAYTIKDVAAFQAGYAIKGEGYFGFDLLAVENLDFTVEAKYLAKEISGTKNKDNEAVNSIKVSETVAYTFEPVTVGIVAHQNLTTDNGAYEFYPYVSVALDNVIEGFSAGLDAGYIAGAKKAGAKIEDTFSITPEITFAVMEKGKAQLYYTFTKQGDSIANAIGIGARYDF